jgi:PTS system nitrogen regulatory IIA component
MQLIDLLTPENVACNVHAGSKKRALEVASEELEREQEQAGSRQIMEGLCAREKLGSTGLGHGVAIPHARIEGLDQPSGVMIRLAEPVDFDAADREPVDLIFALVVPEAATEEHLQLLSQIAELFGDEQRRDSVRRADDAKAMYDVIARWHAEPHGA